MTIEEAEVRANAGDIEYMLLLGEYYAGQGGNLAQGWRPSGLKKHVNQWIYQMYPSYRQEW